MTSTDTRSQETLQAIVRKLHQVKPLRAAAAAQPELDALAQWTVTADQLESEAAAAQAELDRRAARFGHATRNVFVK